MTHLIITSIYVINAGKLRQQQKRHKCLVALRKEMLDRC
jgi:hypothetical protein